ncbi:MAG: hypothetical protein LBK61_02840 [Spirochaetaceae bacterium]|jgi:hypothetical protein|nr:hypothetical protein [Spirochaetaceae bacterium]
MKKFFMGMIALSVSLIFLGCPSGDDDEQVNKSAAESLVDQLGDGFTATGDFEVTLAADGKTIASGVKVEIPTTITLKVPTNAELTVATGGTFSVKGTLSGAAGAKIVVQSGAAVSAASGIFYVGAVALTDVGEGTYAWNATNSRWEKTGVSATVADVTIAGTVDEAIATAVDVVITLVNDTFKVIALNADLSGWITNLPAGLTAVAKSAVAAEATTVTIAVGGTPEAVSSAALAITIPAASLTTSDTALTVTANANAKFAVTTTEPYATVGDVTVTGTVGTALAATVDVVITLVNDTIKTQIAANADLAEWITNLPEGLTAVAKTQVAALATEVTIAVAGTPAAAISEPLEITIPVNVLTTTGNATLEVTANNAAKFEVVAAAATDPSAAVGDVTITGTAGVAIVEPFDVVITLSNDTFKAITKGADLAAWITNLPLNLTAVAKDAVTGGSGTTVTITVSGTPAAVFSAALEIAIPANVLTSNPAAALAVTANNAAKFEIAAAPVPSATVSTKTIAGTVGGTLEAGFDLTITLAHDTFVGAFTAGTDDLKAWITNLPGGLTAKVKETVQAGGTAVTITVAGEPAAASGQALAITIPANILDATGNATLTVTPNPDVKFNIAGTAAVAEVEIAGTVGTNDPTGTEVAITLATGDTFVAIAQGTNVADWFSALNGLSAVVKEAVAGGTGSYEVKITVSGNPNATSTAPLVITIPADKLTSGVEITVTKNTSAVFNITD